ncbi:MAG: chorismate synthase [Eubacterium sp.]|nr:chorismate synthase [Eubacterium sp.]
MAGSVFGEVFRISTWGESHGPALGVVVDGCPAGIPLSGEDFTEAMARRAPGQTKYATPRSETDTVEILSGVFEGKTTGTPISLVIRNTSQRSGDYSEVAGYYRPGHADFTFDAKYGFRDYRGGGRSSGRETAARVAAGCVAGKLLAGLGVDTTAYVKQIGPYCCRKNVYQDGIVPSREQIEAGPLRMPDEEASAQAEEYLAGLMEEGDSAGGVIECIVTGVPAGIGEPVFDKLDARLGQAIFSIGAVKGVEIGDGFHVAEARGSENNDGFIPTEDGVGKTANRAGGILGGISDGNPIVLRAAFKPTPSIRKEQQTVNRKGEAVSISVKGRHDPVIVPRAVVVVEAMVNLVLADLMLIGLSTRMEDITNYYVKN